MQSTTGPVPPDTFPNPRGDNAWDNDAVQWMLLHSDVAAHFDRGALMECARRQPKRQESDLDRVILAAKLCERHGVEQVQVLDAKIGKTIWRLRRTDPDAPEYPSFITDSGVGSDGMSVDAEDRIAAERLTALLPSYDQVLRSEGKSANTVFTYVDRAERFLRRVMHE